MPITARHAARLANLAYLDGQEAEFLAEDEGYTSCSFMEAGDTQCLCIEYADDVAVSFRGTEPFSVQDWLGNLDSRKIINQFGPGKIHRGFSDELEVIWPQVFNYLEASKKRTHFIGHSKGGALANIAALRMIYSGRETPGLWTFGAPRCMNKKAALHLEKKAVIYRFVNYTDPVTWLPRGWWGFRHASPAIYFRNFEREQILDDPPYRLIWCDAMGEIVKNKFQLHKLALRDHLMLNYTLQIVCHFGAGGNKFSFFEEKSK